MHNVQTTVGICGAPSGGWRAGPDLEQWVQPQARRLRAAPSDASFSRRAGCPRRARRPRALGDVPFRRSACARLPVSALLQSCSNSPAESTMARTKEAIRQRAIKLTNTLCITLEAGVCKVRAVREDPRDAPLSRTRWLAGAPGPAGACAGTEPRWNERACAATRKGRLMLHAMDYSPAGLRVRLKRRLADAAHARNVHVHVLRALGPKVTHSPANSGPPCLAPCIRRVPGPPLPDARYARCPRAQSSLCEP